eukprot:gene2455-2493_t
MSKSKLRVRPKSPNDEGRVHHVTPKSAGWTYVGFDVFDLASGASLSKKTKDMEVCLVLVSGKAKISVKVNGKVEDFGELGERMSPFDGAPWSVYVPAHASWSVEATTKLELAVCASPATGKLPARVIGPAQCGKEVRGKGTNTRHVSNILPETEPAESLLVVEVITPGGNWSSYPPHKHDRDMLPTESYLEETYYHRLNPPQGYAVQRVYTDDRSIDEAVVIADRDVVLRMAMISIIST